MADSETSRVADANASASRNNSPKSPQRGATTDQTIGEMSADEGHQKLDGGRRRSGRKSELASRQKFLTWMEVNAVGKKARLL